MASDNDEEVTKDLAALQAMVNRLKLTGKEATDYVHDHMTKLGYKSRRSYYRDAKNSSSSGSWWKKGDDSGGDDE